MTLAVRARRAQRPAAAGPAAGARRQGDLAPGAAVRGARRRPRAASRTSPTATTSRAPRAALEQLGVRIRAERTAASIDRGRGVDGLARARRRSSTAATRARRCACCAGSSPVGRSSSMLTGDASLVAAADGPGRRAAAGDGRARSTAAPTATLRAARRSGAARCTGVRHELAVASGQVKTALVLAGLQADGRRPRSSSRRRAAITPSGCSARCGAPVERVDDRTVRVARRRAGAVRARRCPGDPSSAAFFVVAATIAPGSAIVLEDVSAEPDPDRVRRRAARAWARDIEVRGHRRRGSASRSATIAVEAAPLHGTTIAGRRGRSSTRCRSLAVAAAFADGRHRDPRRGRARGEGEQPHRRAASRSSRSSASGSRPRPRRARRPRRAARRARRSRATATTASRWRGGRRTAPRTGETTVRGWRAVGDLVPRLRAGPRDPAGRLGLVSAPVVAIDGPSGSGKSTVGARRRDAARACTCSTPARCTGRSTLAVLERRRRPRRRRRLRPDRARTPASSSRTRSCGSTGATSAPRSAAPR